MASKKYLVRFAGLTLSSRSTGSGLIKGIWLVSVLSGILTIINKNFGVDVERIATYILTRLLV
jgi:hypothetical protein